MNYIQILYLCILKQPLSLPKKSLNSCELHSNLVSLHSETTNKRLGDSYFSCELHSNLVSLHSETTTVTRRYRRYRLWITFKSCIFAFWNNSYCIFRINCFVVNYIQILYLCILKQRRNAENCRARGCELHSNLVSLHSETTIYF